MAKRPNLLYVFADQMRARDMGCSGNPDVLTPHMDRLAARGVRFTNGTTCIPVCTPARACLLTGRYPLSTGVFLNDLQLDTSEITIAHALRDGGYDTAYVGKWHLDGPRRWDWTPPGPRRGGFDYWHAVNCDHRDYLDPIYYEDSNDPIRPGYYCGDYETDVALKWILSHENENSSDNEKPFAMFLSWSPPHNPYEQLPDRWTGRYDPDSIKIPPNTLDTQEERKNLADYYAQISALDDNLGRLMDGLEEAGVLEDTILVFTSDHGDMLGAHGKTRKQWPWDESVLVPFIVSWPDALPAGQVSNVIFNTPYQMPTLLSWMGVKCPESVDGNDLTRAIAGEEDGPTTAFLMIIHPFAEQVSTSWRAVRSATHTYAISEKEPWLLYDNISDPDQLKNLLEDPKYAEVQRFLAAELSSWLGKTGDANRPSKWFLDEYGYETDPQNGAAGYTYDLNTGSEEGPKHQIARSR